MAVPFLALHIEVLPHELVMNHPLSTASDRKIVTIGPLNQDRAAADGFLHNSTSGTVVLEAGSMDDRYMERGSILCGACEVPTILALPVTIAGPLRTELFEGPRVARRTSGTVYSLSLADHK